MRDGDPETQLADRYDRHFYMHRRLARQRSCVLQRDEKRGVG